MQSKLSSFIEATINMLLGILIGVLTQLLIFPFFNIEVSIKDNFGMAILFALLGLVRSYIVRRWFNTRIKKIAKGLTNYIE